MFRKNDAQEDNNFWISYADLMAGLLFVFILLIGAIVSKSIILKSILHTKEDRLNKTEALLEEKMNKLSELTLEVKRKEELMRNKDGNLTTQEKIILKKNKELIFRDQEIKKLNKLLLNANTQRDRLNGKIILVQNLLTKSKDTVLKIKIVLNLMKIKYLYSLINSQIKIILSNLKKNRCFIL